MSAYIVTEIKDQVLTIQVNRAEKKNSITMAMYTALTEALNQLEADDNLRVGLITGAADSFCAGNDLMDFLANPPEDPSSPVFIFLTTLAQAQKPIIAAVNGVAVGIGTTMLLHCDLVYAAETARFQLPFVNLGLVPEGASTLLLPKLLGHQKTAELLFFGDFFDSKKAVELGFVNEIFSSEELMEQAFKKALRLAKQPPAALRLTKSLIKRAGVEDVLETIAVEGDDFARLLKAPEAQEALLAFKERRKPNFSQFN